MLSVVALAMMAGGATTVTFVLILPAGSPQALAAAVVAVVSVAVVVG